MEIDTYERNERLLDADETLVKASGALTQALACRREDRDTAAVDALRDQYATAASHYQGEVRAALREEG